MAENDGAGRRPPHPPGCMSAAKPPPTPAARMKSHSPEVAPPAQSASGLPETRKKFKEITGEGFFAQFKKALHMVSRSCRLPMQDFSTFDNVLLFRTVGVARFEGGAMDLPLGTLGPESDIYRFLHPSIMCGMISAPSLSGLSSLPPGLFLRISDSGIELRFRAAEMAAPQAQAPNQKMLLASRRLLQRMCLADPSLPMAISLSGNSILFRNGDELIEIAKIPEHGEARIYLKDLGWDDAKCKALLASCRASISEDRVRFLFMHREVYLRIGENGFALCASNKRESEPLIYQLFSVE